MLFTTKIGGGGVDAPVVLDGTNIGPGPDFSAQLFLVKSDGAFLPLFPITNFRDGSVNRVAMQYVVPATVTVPGVLPGESATFVMRAWETALGSYEDAVRAGYHYGEGELTMQFVGGEPFQVGILNGMRGFSIVVPEPGVLSIAFMGIGVFLLLKLCNDGQN